MNPGFMESWKPQFLESWIPGNLVGSLLDGKTNNYSTSHTLDAWRGRRIYIHMADSHLHRQKKHTENTNPTWGTFG